MKPPIWRGIFLLGVLTLIAYLPALRGGFIWDDDDYVTDNANLQSFSGLVDTWIAPRSSPQYYPLVFTSFWIEHQLWGLHPLGYHLDNVLLHAAAAILLWRVLVRLDVPAAFFAACLFALHPVHVESVAWITERKNVLSAVFYFAAALAFLRAHHVPALFLFAAALLSKSVTCSLPAALLLIVWWKREPLAPRQAAWLAVMFAMGVAMAIVTARLEVLHVRASGAEWDLSVLDRILIAGRAVWFYAGKLLLPFNLSFIYPKWRIDPSLAWQWAFPAGVFVAVAALWAMRDRWGRGPLIAALFFIGTLMPALGFFNIYPMRYSYAADHFQYLASVGLLVPIAAALRRLGRAAPVILAPLLVLTMLRANVFSDAEILWRDTLAKNPDSWMAHLNLAKVLVAKNRLPEAIGHFEAQVKLAPQLPETHWNYASSLFIRGLYDPALAEYTQAIRLGGNDPLPQAFYGRGRVLLMQNRPAEAAAEFRHAIELKPDFEAARQWLEIAQSRQVARYPALAMKDRAHLLTEQRLPESMNLDAMSVEQIIDLMNAQDAKAVAVVAAVKDAVADAVRIVVGSLKAGGRLIYVGAGTSGRLGVLDAAECPPTFRTDPEMVQGIIAGGSAAMFAAQEGAEDRADEGAKAIDDKQIGSIDTVIGIAAGGTTPFVHGALRRAAERGAWTIFLTCVGPMADEPVVDLVIRPLTGPEVVTGSTRLKAATVTKLVLNMITTISMVQLNKVYENLMVDLRATNLKLWDRGARIIATLTGLPRDDAMVLLKQADGHVKVAIVMHKQKVLAPQAREMLDHHEGKLRNAIDG